MKYADGFTVPCKHAYWEIYDERDNKDFICRGNSENYGWFCNFNDKCRGYEPDIKEGREYEQSGKTDRTNQNNNKSMR